MSQEELKVFDTVFKKYIEEGFLRNREYLKYEKPEIHESTALDLLRESAGKEEVDRVCEPLRPFLGRHEFTVERLPGWWKKFLYSVQEGLKFSTDKHADLSAEKLQELHEMRMNLLRSLLKVDYTLFREGITPDGEKILKSISKVYKKIHNITPSEKTHEWYKLYTVQREKNNVYTAVFSKSMLACFGISELAPDREGGGKKWRSCMRFSEGPTSSSHLQYLVDKYSLVVYVTDGTRTRFGNPGSYPRRNSEITHEAMLCRVILRLYENERTGELGVALDRFYPHMGFAVEIAAIVKRICEENGLGFWRFSSYTNAQETSGVEFIISDRSNSFRGRYPGLVPALPVHILNYDVSRPCAEKCGDSAHVSARGMQYCISACERSRRWCENCPEQEACTLSEPIFGNEACHLQAVACSHRTKAGCDIPYKGKRGNNCGDCPHAKLEVTARVEGWQHPYNDNGSYEDTDLGDDGIQFRKTGSFGVIIGVEGIGEERYSGE